MSKSLDGILNKLSHPLPEVRCRALRSLISKLDHGLIHESNLVPERAFIVKFLEWFNFDSNPMTEDVLQLLKRLSMYENARLVLLSLGGVEFFSKLRNDIVGPSVHDIDAILRNLSTPNANKAVNNHAEPIPQGTQDSRFFSNPNTFVPDMAASYLAFPGFPWHFLTATDRHVLSSTSTSLNSPDPSLVENACMFLLDVVLHDFPAEIFLQRPTIINTLMILLRSGADVSILCIACECLSLIAKNLGARIMSYQDPDFHCPRQGLPGYYNSIRELTSQYDSFQAGSDGWERNGGDGQDRTGSSSLSSEYDVSLQVGERDSNIQHIISEDGVSHSSSLDDDSFLASQLSQLSVPEFTFSCLQSVADLLCVDSPIIFFDAYEVAMNCVQVLSHIFNVDALWSEDQGICDGVRTRIKLLSGIMSRCVLYHSHLKCDKDNENWQTKQFKTMKDSVFHRIAFQVCSVLFLRFLQGIIANDRIVYLSALKSVENVLLLVASDQAFKISSPNLHNLAVTYLKHFDGRHQLVKLEGALECIQCIQNFKEVSAQQGDFKSLLMLADGSLDGLQYYNPTGFIPQVIDLISMVKPSFGELHCHKAKSILLKLMSHSDLKVQAESYTSCQRVMMKLFENLEDSSLANSCYFMINGDVFRELIVHGLNSASSRIKSASHDILMSLLRGKYFMDNEQWVNFLDEVKVHLPNLQSFAVESDVLRKVILDFIAANYDDVTRLVCLLRFLMLKSRKVRSFASPLLLEYLTSSANGLVGDSEDKEVLNALLKCLIQIDDFTDRLVANQPVPMLGKKSSLRSLAASEELMSQMLSVLRFKDTSKAKRLATLQQLACMLSVKESHDMFLKSDGLLTVRRHLCHISSNSVLTKHETEEATSCLLITLKVCAENNRVRTSLLLFPTILTLVRFVVLSHNFSDTSNLAAQVLTLLMLNGVLKTECGNPDPLVSLSVRFPARIMSHYHISVPCLPHNVIGLHRPADGRRESPNLLEVGPASFAIESGVALAQNHHDVRATIENLKATQSSDTSADSTSLQIALLCSTPDVYIDEFAASVANARIHAAVSRDVRLLRTLLLTYEQDYLKAMLNSEKWRASLETFVIVQPSSTDDMKLLCDIVTLLGDVVRTVPSSQLPVADKDRSYEEGLQSTLVWYVRAICGSGTPGDVPLLDQLKSPSLKSEHLSGLGLRAKEQRRLCKSVLSMMSHISATILVLPDKSIVRKFQSTLCRIILFRLKLANTPRYYDLPSMEVTLDCLLHNTAACAEKNSSAEFFYDDDSMPVQLMSSLFEVVSAFHIENSGSNMSYMGRGVSKTATQNIVNIVFGAANQTSQDPETSINWLDMVSQGFPVSAEMSGKYAATKHKKSYKWILALWPARDPLIRYCGLLLTSMITRQSDSCGIMQEYFRDYPGGIWRVLLSVLFDSTECSAVRTEAAYVCCNLVLHVTSSGKTTMEDSEFGKILRQYGFYQGCCHILTRYHPCCWIKPSSLILYPHMYPMEITSSYVTDEIPVHNRSDDAESQSRVSGSSNGSDFPPEWEASVTPTLLAAMCHLLSNIFTSFDDLNVVHRHADIVQTISCLIDPPLLEKAITNFVSCDKIDVTKGRLQFSINSLTRFFSQSCKLLHVYMSKDKSAKILQATVNNREVLLNIVCLATSDLALTFGDSDTVKSAMDLLSFIIVNCDSDKDIEAVREIIISQWTRFCACTKSAISDTNDDVTLKIASVTLLTNVTSLVKNELDIESRLVTDIADLCSICIELLKSLLKNSREMGTFDGVLKCSYALQSLFVFRPSKLNALDAGFLDYLMEEINFKAKSLSKQYQYSGKVEMKKGKVHAKRNTALATLLVLLRVLSSLLANSNEVQVSALEQGLCHTLQDLWKSMSDVGELKSTLLKVAICYTVRCEETSASLTTCTAGRDSFMSCIMSEAQDMNRSVLASAKVNQRNFKDVFRLLGNLSISKECRSMLWKGAFLTGFTAAADKGRHPRCTKLQQMLLQHWLNLIHCISFFPDGQLNILKIQDVLVILDGIYTDTDNSNIVFKILSNMCYHGPSKARMSSNQSMVDIISSGLESNSCCQALSALRALLSGCQKSKVFLKDAQLPVKIMNAQNRCSAEPNFRTQAKLLLQQLAE